MEIIFALLGFAVVIAVVVVALVLPIVALVQIRQLAQRLRALKRDVRRLQDNVLANDDRETAAVRVPQRRTSEALELPMEVEEFTPSAESTPARSAEPPAEPTTKHRVEPAPELDWSKLEAWLGMRGLGWAAVILLIISGAFFLKLVFDEGLIGELGRIMVGIGLGAVLCLTGRWCYGRGQFLFCQMLTTGGIALFYLAAYASFGFYQLLESDQAAPFLMLIAAEAFALAALYNVSSIAIVAVACALLTPLLLHADQDRHVQLFTYLAVLNAGVAGLSLARRWWAVNTLALLGTHGLFWGWHEQWYHAEILPACALFLGGIFVLYIGQMLLVHVWQRKTANPEDLIRLILLALLTSVAGYALLHVDYRAWLGSIAVLLGIVFALLAGLVNRYRPSDEPLLLVLLALAMACVAAVFPLQTEAAWIAVGWAVQGLALWWFGLRVWAQLLYGMGAAFLALALLRLLLVDTLEQTVHEDPFLPIFNRYGLPATLVSGCVILAALLQRRTNPEPNSAGFVIMRLMGLAGVISLLIVFSIETYDFFVVRGNIYAPGVQAMLTPEEHEMRQQDLLALFAERARRLRLAAQMSLSVLWGLFALTLLGLGLRLRHRPLRWLALILFAVTLSKVMIVDTERLAGIYRVGAFFALSLVMAAGAWAYQKLRRILLAADAEQT